jgi:hypothetical protein
MLTALAGRLKDESLAGRGKDITQKRPRLGHANYLHWHQERPSVTASGDAPHHGVQLSKQLATWPNGGEAAMEAPVSITVAKRHPKRIRVMLDSVIETPRGQQKVRIRDISRDGMMMETDGTSVIGEALKLSLGDNSFEGKVAWQVGAWSGVAFRTALDTHVWEALCRQPLIVTMPRGYRHDQVANDQVERVEVTPRLIRFDQSRAIV